MECAPTAYRMPCLNEDTQSWASATWSEGEAGSETVLADVPGGMREKGHCGLNLVS